MVDLLGRLALPERFSISRSSLRLSLLAVCLLGLSGCALWRQNGDLREEAALADEIVAVDAVMADTGTATEEFAYTGTTRPHQEVALRARIDAQVTLLTVDVGDSVAAGDAIARLDADLFNMAVSEAEAELRAREAEVAQARASVSDARTALEAARVQLQQDQADAARLARLAAEGAISIQEAEQAQLAVDTTQQVLQSAQEQIRTRQAAVSAAEGRVRAQQAVVSEAQEQLSFAVVRSPLSGVVLNRTVEAGDYVETGDELLRVGDLNQIEVVIEVSDLNLSEVSLGQSVDVELDAFPGERLSGRITRIAPAADATSRLIPVEITVPNKTGKIGSGLLARVDIQAESRDRITIPSDALDLTEDAPNPTIFVVQSQNGSEATLQARTVTVGREENNQVEILSGLSPDEVFVVRASGPLSNGQTVRLSILSETDQESSS